jgi:methyltransferase (TIGR00027 family)
MRVDQPSLTALGVALARSRLERPSTPHGDPAGDQALAVSLLDDAPERYRRRAARLDTDRSVDEEWRALGGWVRARTRFFDDAVLGAIDDGVTQVVILGAGYDGRALRFRSPGVRFFEVDHPATQDDKRRRLTRLGVDAHDVEFVSADFTQPGLASVLERAGHRADERSLFVLEGVLRYLPEHWFRELLAVLAARAAPRGELAVSISTRLDAGPRPTPTNASASSTSDGWPTRANRCSPCRPGPWH